MTDMLLGRDRPDRFLPKQSSCEWEKPPVAECTIRVSLKRKELLPALQHMQPSCAVLRTIRSALTR